MSSTEIVHYPKIKRLPLYSVPYRKEPLSDSEIEKLFSSEVVVEEKIDGKFSSREYEDYIVFYEYMGIRHSIFYTNLPSFMIAFDVYDKKSRRFLGVPEKHEVLKSLDWCYVPVIYIGKIDINSWREKLLELMKRPSYYGAPLIEGVVVKNYNLQLFAKAINKEFDEAIRGEPHYTEKGKIEENIMYSGEGWDRLCNPVCEKQ